MRVWLSFMLLPVLLEQPFTNGLHITGKWDSSNFFTILAKFGVQQTDNLHQLHTQGYIYGNITILDSHGKSFSCTTHDESQAEVYLLLTHRQLFEQIVTNRNGQSDGPTCGRMMAAVHQLAFHPTCSPKATQDFLRRVPCPSGKLCCDEDDPRNVMDNFQFTYSLRDTKQPRSVCNTWLRVFILSLIYSFRFWFLSFLSCYPDSNCSWVPQKEPLILAYDIWLVNGSPRLKYQNPFEHQFSFDKQDTAEIYLVALVLVTVLLIVQAYSHFGLFRSRKGLLLLVTLTTSFVSMFCNCVHAIVFSFDGVGSAILEVAGGVAFVLAENLLLVGLLLIASGWSVTKLTVASTVVQRILVMWGAILILHLILYFLNEVSRHQQV